jgi:hypothetical protein
VWNELKPLGVGIYRVVGGQNLIFWGFLDFLEL